MVNPPMITVASGAYASIPVFGKNATGIRTTRLTIVVIKIGRRRTGPAARIASLRDIPFFRLCRIKSKSKIALLTAMPFATTMPRIETVEKF